MTKELLVSLDWREISNGTNYMYGTKINFQDGKVLMDNPQIAPGKPLRTFVSRTNYQGNRRSPELPLLIPKRDYYLEVVAEAEPLQHFFVEMIFYNRHNESVGNFIFRESYGEFTCPEEIYTYTIILRTAGCTYFVFECLNIYQDKVQMPLRSEKKESGSYTTTGLLPELDLIRPLLNTTIKKVQ